MFAILEGEPEQDLELRHRFIQWLLSRTPEQHHVLATALRRELDMKNLFLFVELQDSLNDLANVAVL